MKWLKRAAGLASVLSFASLLLFYEYTTRPRPDLVAPRELYAAVQRHLEACRSKDFPQAYYTAASRVQARLTLVQFERELTFEDQPMAQAARVEYGAVHRARGAAESATVDVYFVARDGATAGWTYLLIFEDGDWKVDHGEPIPGWHADRYLPGTQV